MEAAQELLRADEAGWFDVPLGEAVSPLSRNYSSSSDTIPAYSESEEPEFDATVSIFDPVDAHAKKTSRTRKPRPQQDTAKNSGETIQTFAPIPEMDVEHHSGTNGILTRSRSSRSTAVLTDCSNIDVEPKRSSKPSKKKSRPTKLTIATQVNPKQLGPARKKAQTTDPELKDNQPPKTQKRAGKKVLRDQECQTDAVPSTLQLDPPSDLSEVTHPSNEQIDFHADDSMYDIPSLSDDHGFQSTNQEANSSQHTPAITQVQNDVEVVKRAEPQETTETEPSSSSSSEVKNPGFLIKIPPAEQGHRAMSVLLPSDLFDGGKTVGIKVVNGEITLISRRVSPTKHSRSSMRKQVDQRCSQKRRDGRPPTRRSQVESLSTSCSCGSCSSGDSQSDLSCHCETEESSDDNTSCCHHQSPKRSTRRRHRY